MSLYPAVPLLPAPLGPKCPCLSLVHKPPDSKYSAVSVSKGCLGAKVWPLLHPYVTACNFVKWRFSGFADGNHGSPWAQLSEQSAFYPRLPLTGTAEILPQPKPCLPRGQQKGSFKAPDTATQLWGLIANSQHPLTPSLLACAHPPDAAGARLGTNLHLFNYSCRPPAMCLSTIYCAFQSPARHSGAFPACTNGGE